MTCDAVVLVKQQDSSGRQGQDTSRAHSQLIGTRRHWEPYLVYHHVIFRSTRDILVAAGSRRLLDFVAAKIIASRASDTSLRVYAQQAKE